MLDPSIEELREYVNNYKLHNNHETNRKNEETQHFSDVELLKLLESESDTSGNIEEQFEKAQHFTKKDSSNVLQVAEINVEGVTLKIRESLYSKLYNALSSNYKTTFIKMDNGLVESKVYDIAKKIEYNTLSTAQDLNSYKLAGADIVVNIERETCHKRLYKSLFNEIEIYRLAYKMQTASSENPQQESTISSTEIESTLWKESKFQDAQSNIEPMAVDTINNNSPKLLDSQNTAVSESEYFSCSSTDHSLAESQQNNAICRTNSNIQESITYLPKVEKVKNRELQSSTKNSSNTVCNNNSYVIKVLADPSNILNELSSSNTKVKLKPVSDYENSQKVSCNVANNHAVKSRQNSEKCKANSNDKQLQVIVLPKEKQLKKVDVTTTNKTLTSTTKNDGIFLCKQKDYFKKIQAKSSKVRSGKNSSNTENECDSEGTKGISQMKWRKRKCQYDSESSANNSHVQQKKSNKNNQNKKQKFSIGIKNEKFNNEKSSNNIDNNEQYNLDNEVLNSGLDDAMMQNCENNLKNGVTREESSVSNVNVSIESQKSSVVKENNCLIDEEAFELERARLDKLREDLEKSNEESNNDVIHSDYKKIFSIIIPIIRKYYPSEFIPDEVCYGHILQNLQIDLIHTDMCDDDMALYIKDSIKTRRYLYENCIVQ